MTPSPKKTNKQTNKQTKRQLWDGMYVKQSRHEQVPISWTGQNTGLVGMRTTSMLHIFLSTLSDKVSWRPNFNKTWCPDDSKTIGHQTCEKQHLRLWTKHEKLKFTEMIANRSVNWATWSKTHKRFYSTLLNQTKQDRMRWRNRVEVKVERGGRDWLLIITVTWTRWQERHSVSFCLIKKAFCLTCCVCVCVCVFLFFFFREPEVNSVSDVCFCCCTEPHETAD